MARGLQRGTLAYLVPVVVLGWALTACAAPLRPAPAPPAGHRIAILTLFVESNEAGRVVGVELQEGRIVPGFGPNVLGVAGPWTVELDGDQTLRFGTLDPRRIEVEREGGEPPFTYVFEREITWDLVVPLNDPTGKDLQVRAIRLYDEAGRLIFEAEVRREGSVPIDVVAVPTPTPTSTLPPPPGSFGYGIQLYPFRVSWAPRAQTEALPLVQGLGFDWVKLQVQWYLFEPSPGRYNFNILLFEDTVNAFREAGINILFSVVTAPERYRSRGGVHGPPDDWGQFTAFLSALTRHFRGRVQAIEVWNEQNLQLEWNTGRRLNAAEYVRNMLCPAYRTIRSIDPSIIVVSGSPTPTGRHDYVVAVDDRVYLEEMYQAGLRTCSDAIGVHPMGFANPPGVLYTGGDYDPERGFDDHRSFFFRNTVEEYREIMLRYEDGGKRLWATEFGWATTDGVTTDPPPGYEFARDINTKQQADYTVRAFERAKNLGYMGVMFLWNLNFGYVTGCEDQKALYSIVSCTDLSLRPAYEALAAIPK